MALNEIILHEQDERVEAFVRTPAFVVVAAALPGLFVATSTANGIYMGLATAVAILAMAVIAPLTRRAALPVRSPTCRSPSSWAPPSRCW